MSLTRRRLLRGVVLVPLAGGVAGCSGDSGENGTDEDDPQNLESYRDTIESELDIAIQTLRVRNDRVQLDFESNHGSDTEQLGYEIGFVSARFGRQVSDGWDVQGLNGSVTTADGVTLSWRLGAETARAFVDGEITAEEFITRIFDTMTES